MVINLKSFNFNPRSREGNDRHSGMDDRLIVIISIHAPAKGTTMIKMLADMFLRFQSTLPRRERRRHRRHDQIRTHNINPLTTEQNKSYKEDYINNKANISIHAPAKGTTGLDASSCGGVHISIHAPAKGTTGRNR